MFDKDKLPKRVYLAQLGRQEKQNMRPKWHHKTIPNRCQTIEILIEQKVLQMIHLGRPGGMRWPPGGITGGAEN